STTLMRRRNATMPAALQLTGVDRGRPGSAPFGWLQVDRDVLHGQVFLDPLDAALAAEATLLDAAERGSRVADQSTVESDHPDIERLRNSERTFDVLGEDIGDQAVLAVVCGGDRVVVVFEGRDRRDRPEDLLVQQ